MLAFFQIWDTLAYYLRYWHIKDHVGNVGIGTDPINLCLLLTCQAGQAGFCQDLHTYLDVSQKPENEQDSDPM